jgi:hypothetical protein
VGRIPVAGKGELMRSLRKIQKRFGAKSGKFSQTAGPWRPQPRRRNLWDKLRDRLWGKGQATGGQAR